MKTGTDRERSEAFAERYRAAKAFLRGEMDRLGLTEPDGWRISETHREKGGGSEIVLRPIHLRLPAPDGLECVVWVEEESGHVDAECTPVTLPRANE